MTSRHPIALATAALLVVVTGCARDFNSLDPADFPNTAEIFIDGAELATAVYQPFDGSKLDALDVDETVVFRGEASARITVPAPGDPSGSYAGGAIVAGVPRDLSEYDAISFWAKASTAVTLNTIGLGNDNTGTSLYTAEAAGLALSTSWSHFTLPIPLPSKLTREQGLMFFAEGGEFETSYNIWFDEVKFVKGGVSNPRPVIPTQTINDEVGGTLNVSGATVTFTTEEGDITMATSSRYFTFLSSDPAVAAVSDEGLVELVGAGTSTITARLGGTDAVGTITVNASAPPATAAPTPDRDAADVISLFSDAYTDTQVDTWSAVWDNADVTDVQIAGDAVKKYTALAFAGIEFTSQPIDASAMTDFHLDVWVQDDSEFKIKLVNFQNGALQSESEVTLSAASMPSITTGAWNSLDIPMSMFAGLTDRSGLAQMIISGASPTVYVDNVYFFKGTPVAPMQAAPTPNLPAGNVVSMFSDAFMDVTVDTWSASWDAADVADVMVDGDATKLYTNLSFAGIEATSAPIDASAATRFHMNIWTPDATDMGVFKIKLVDFGADASFGGGDDVEHELTFSATSTPALASGSWVTLDVPLSDFTGLTTTGAIAQMIISGDPNTVYVDNVLFYSPPPTSPPAPAPTPTLAAGNVISLFSNAYTDVPVDTWLTSWSNAAQEDIQIAGDDVKKYTNLNFAGIEMIATPVDASAMTHFHIDVWTPDPTAAPAAFKIKIVDLGADGAFGGGDDVEHEVVLNAASTPPLASWGWVSYDIPLSDFTNLTTTGALGQLILSADPNTVFVDNVYLHN